MEMKLDCPNELSRVVETLESWAVRGAVVGGGLGLLGGWFLNGLADAAAGFGPGAAADRHGPGCLALLIGGTGIGAVVGMFVACLMAGIVVTLEQLVRMVRRCWRIQ